MQADRGPRYSGVAMLLHWTIAILVIMNWRIAETAEHLQGAARDDVWGYHMAWGITILVLTLARLAWRLVHKPPALSAHLKPWERALAKTVHTVFYILLIGLPLGGWLAMSMYGSGIDWFGLFTVPALPTGTNKALGETIFEAHATGGTVLLLLIALHVLGALKHTFIDRDGTLWRMLPFGKPGA